MKQVWIIIIATCILCGCTPTPLPCDPCAEIDALSTRVAILEGVTDTPTATPSATASSTPSRTATREPTGTPTRTPTWTPETLVTLTPTPQGGPLSLTADRTQATPASRVGFTITWSGGPARLQFQWPANTCCAIPDATNWTATGPMSVQFTFLMQTAASGVKMFRVLAYDAANNLIATAFVFVDVVTSNPTATPTVRPTLVPGSGQTLKAATWYEVRNPVSEMICLKVESSGELRGDKRLYWQDQEFWTWIEFTSGPGWRCFCGTFYWDGFQRKATQMLFIFDADALISDCRLCTWIQFSDLASGRGVSGVSCEVRG